LGFFSIPGAAAGFFLSAWFTMVFWGMVAPDLGIATIGYPKAMLVTIAVWLVIAPLAAAIAKSEAKKPWFFWRRWD